jgi:hypothetical protein
VSSGEPVTYDLANWPPDARGALAEQLADAGIEVRWAVSSFVVPATRRADVDALIARMNGATPTAVTAVAPGWYPDPLREAQWRWWDGAQWTAHVGPAIGSSDRGWFPPRGNREHGARGGGLALAGFVGGQLLALAVVLLAIALGASSRSVVTLLLGEFALWSGLFTACKLAVDRHGSGALRELDLLRPRLGDLGIGSLAALVGRVATLIIAVIVVQLFSFENFARDTSVTNPAGVSILGAIVVSLVVVVGAPFFEELFFRGLVQGVLTRRYGARRAIAFQAVAFGLVHYQIGMTVGQTVLTFSMIMPVGFLLGCLRWRYQRLGPGMAAHALFNAMAVAIMFAVS